MKRNLEKAKEKKWGLVWRKGIIGKMEPKAQEGHCPGALLLWGLTKWVYNSQRISQTQPCCPFARWNKASQRWGAAKSGSLGALWKPEFAWMAVEKPPLVQEKPQQGEIPEKILPPLPCCDIPVTVGSVHVWDKFSSAFTGLYSGILRKIY